jgi:hypothetical protein
MPITGAKADGNVPFLPGRARYNVVTDRSFTWVFQKMLALHQFDGSAPTDQIDGSARDTFDPTTVRGGYASWDGCAHAGLWTLLSHYGRAMTVQEVSNAAGATLSTVDSSGAVLRTSLPATPFMLSPGECLKASGGTAGGAVGFLVKFDEATIL